MKGLDAKAMEFINWFILDIKRLGYGKMKLRPGSEVLDVGCGSGFDVVHLSAEVGRSGLAIGLDIDESVLPREVSGSTADTSCFVVGDAHSLPMRDANFDVVWADRLLQHVRSPIQVLREMRRVVRLGGSIVLADADHYSATVKSNDSQQSAKLMSYRADQIRNGSAGRLLEQWCYETNISVLDTQMHKIAVDDLAIAKAVGLFFDDWHLKYADEKPACAKDVERFMADLEQMDSRSQFRFESYFFVLTGMRTEA